MERRRIPLRNQERPAYPSSRILLGSRLSSLVEDFSTRRRTENSSCPTSGGSFRVAIVCCARPLKKGKRGEKKEKGKEKRTEGCRKNRVACSCAQQHVPRILEKLDIPQSSASRMSSREIYKGLRASLPGSATM